MKHVENTIVENLYIFFDGYLDSKTKDQCHRKWNPIQSNWIDFTSNMILDCRKDLFLSNSTNKHLFVNLLVVWLISAGHHAVQHTDDADRIIADKAISLAEENNVCVYADDTDLLVLMLHKLQTTMNHTVYLHQEKSNRTINLTSLVNVMPDKKRSNILLSHAMSVATPLLDFLELVRQN